MLEIIITIAVILLDLVSKILSANILPTLENGVFPIIDGLFDLSYMENTGAAFSMLQNGRWIFVGLTVVVAAILITLMIKERKLFSTFLRVALALVLGGALGNFIDRLFLGYVRDMFNLHGFAVFNVADSAITVGGIMLGIELLFTKRGRELFNLLDDKTKKKSTAGETEELKDAGEEK